ncbi:MAG TPA: AAC(3) family N-acetyltransferase [Abditibacteriaceae bacterium]|nr:AAC(3) family N-acetyltransferase [Abditibacteriaceae bacterium]
MNRNWPTFSDVLNGIDTAWLLEQTERLWQVERGACFRHWHEAADMAASLLHNCGLERVEKIPVRADGKTTCLDRTMPLAWDVTDATLTVQRAGVSFDDPIVASYQRHPFHLIKGSVATPPEGVLTKLISEQQLFGGEDAVGAMVMLEPDSYPRAPLLRALLDLGALGFVADQLSGRYDTPDGMTWYNAVTEGAHWHVQASDRPFIGFAVSPRTGDRLRAAVRQGQTVVHVHSDARRYEGVFHTVTGVIPGEEEREVWLMAHLYEPMPDDNAAGVIAALEVARSLRRMMDAGHMDVPRFTLRLIFTMEMYGYAAYAAQRGVPLRDHVLGAINLDAVSTKPTARLFLAPPDAPFCGDYLLEQVLDEYRVQDQPPHITLHERGWYADDMFLSDPATGLPTVWLIGNYEWWHNSEQSMTIFEPHRLARHTAFYATWIARLLSLRETQREEVIATATTLAQRHLQVEADSIGQRFAQADGAARQRLQHNAATWMQWRFEREEARLHDFKRVWDLADLEADIVRLRQFHDQVTADLLRNLAPVSGEPQAIIAMPVRPVRDVWATSIIPQRTVPWSPHDQANIPPELRSSLPGNVIYGPFATVLAHADGRRTLRELIEYAEWAHEAPISESTVKHYISALERLARYGHLRLSHTQCIGRAQIACALRDVGLTEGDLVLVHSSLSSFGHIEGGAETVIEAFIEVLGPNGTVLMPTFTNSVIYCNGQCIAQPTYRPFDSRSSHVWVGQIPSVFLQRPDIRRSVHPTHSVAARGPLSEYCLDEHHEDDPPTGCTSPFAKLVESGGKMVWFGADLASCTFFHYLEDAMEMSYLQPALCRVRRDNGQVYSVLVPKWLPGHRDFYTAPGQNSKMYQRLIADGLVIQEATLGIGQIKLIEAKPMYDLGMAALMDDPRLMLCDSSDCLFCREC